MHEVDGEAETVGAEKGLEIDPVGCLERAPILLLRRLHRGCVVKSFGKSLLIEMDRLERVGFCASTYKDGQQFCSLRIKH